MICCIYCHCILHHRRESDLLQKHHLMQDIKMAYLQSLFCLFSLHLRGKKIIITFAKVQRYPETFWCIYMCIIYSTGKRRIVALAKVHISSQAETPWCIYIKGCVTIYIFTVFHRLQKNYYICESMYLPKYVVYKNYLFTFSHCDTLPIYSE